MTCSISGFVRLPAKVVREHAHAIDTDLLKRHKESLEAFKTALHKYINRPRLWHVIYKPKEKTLEQALKWFDSFEYYWVGLRIEEKIEKIYGFNIVNYKPFASEWYYTCKNLDDDTDVLIPIEDVQKLKISTSIKLQH